MLRCAVACLALLLLAACGSVRPYPDERYCGPTAEIVPETPQARASAAGPFSTDACGNDAKVYVRICGSELGTFKGSSFEVPAGRHDLQLVFEQSDQPQRGSRLRTKPVVMQLTAQGGRCYVIRGVAGCRDGRWGVKFWAVETESRKTVATVAVPQDRIELVDDPWVSGEGEMDWGDNG